MAKGFDEFPLWLNDWRGSTARAEMNLAERGAYIELLTWQFSLGGKGAKGLPADDESLARLLAVSLKEWQAVKPAVLARFEKRGGKLVNGKVEKAVRYRRGAKAGGETRAKTGERGENGRFEPAQPPAQAPAQAPAQVQDSISISISSPSEEEPGISSASSEAERKPSSADADAREEFASLWNELAQRHGRPEVRRLDAKRCSRLRARLREHPDLWTELDAELAQLNEFTREGAWLTFDWLLCAENLEKLLSGKYRAREVPAEEEHMPSDEELSEFIRREKLEGRL